jgi:hypothetical protein
MDELSALSFQLSVAGLEDRNPCEFVRLKVYESGISTFGKMNGFQISKMADPQDGQFGEMVVLWDGQIGEWS